MAIFHIVWVSLVVLAWAAHQHVTAAIAGTPMYSGSLLVLIAFLMGLVLLAALLALVRALVREFRPAY